MVQTNTFINKTLLLVLMALSLTAQAQRIGVKPFIGLHYNNTKVDANQAPLFLNGKSGYAHTTGIILSYQFAKKWGAEVGSSSIITSTKFEAQKLNNNEIIASINNYNPKRVWLLSCSYYLQNKPKYNLKMIAGLDLKNNRNVLFAKTTKRAFIDTNYITFENLAITERKLRTPLFQVITGIHFGIGYEFKYKQIPVGEFRFTTRYNITTQNRITIGYKDNGNVYTNFTEPSLFSCNVSLMVNLSALLGAYWKQSANKE